MTYIKRVKLTMNYIDRFLPMMDENHGHSDSHSVSDKNSVSESDNTQRNKAAADTFHKLIRAGDIESCSLFDTAAWDGFQNSDPSVYKI